MRKIIYTFIITLTLSCVAEDPGQRPVAWLALSLIKCISMPETTVTHGTVPGIFTITSVCSVSGLVLTCVQTGFALANGTKVFWTPSVKAASMGLFGGDFPEFSRPSKREVISSNGVTTDLTYFTHDSFIRLTGFHDASGNTGTYSNHDQNGFPQTRVNSAGTTNYVYTYAQAGNKPTHILETGPGGTVNYQFSDSVLTSLVSAGLSYTMTSSGTITMCNPEL